METHEFCCTGMDGRGTEKKLTIEASDERHAAALLKEQGLFPTSILRKETKANSDPSEIQPFKMPMISHELREQIVIVAAIVLVVVIAVCSTLFSLNAGRAKYRLLYENSVKQTIQEMVREECLKKQ